MLSGDFGEVLESDDEAAFRMLVVDPAARGRGIGELLVRACLERARSRRQAADGAVDRRPDGGGAPALRAARVHPAAGTGLVAATRREPAGVRARPLRSPPPRDAPDRARHVDDREREEQATHHGLDLVVRQRGALRHRPCDRVADLGPPALEDRPFRATQRPSGSGTPIRRE